LSDLPDTRLLTDVPCSVGFLGGDFVLPPTS
jgi:hypothetical protein